MQDNKNKRTVQWSARRNQGMFELFFLADNDLIVKFYIAHCLVYNTYTSFGIPFCTIIVVALTAFTLPLPHLMLSHSQRYPHSQLSFLQVTNYYNYIINYSNNLSMLILSQSGIHEHIDQDVYIFFPSWKNLR